MKKVLILARTQQQLDSTFDTFIDVLSSKKGLEVKQLVGDSEFLNAVSPTSEYDLIIVLCEYGFLVEKILALKDDHKPILCIDIYDEEDELESNVDILPDVYLIGFVTMDEKLEAVNKALKTKIF